MKLTDQQTEELRALAKAPQRTYGRHRARVQRNLAALGLAAFANEDGTPWKHGLEPGADLCVITDRGRAEASQLGSEGT